MEISPGLHWIEGHASNVYLWTGESGILLVDTGMPADARRISRYLAEIGLEPASIEAIFITHADYDHAGSAAELQALSGAKVVAGPQTAGFLSRGTSPKHLPRLSQLVVDTILKPYVKYKAVPAGEIRQVSDHEFIDEAGEWTVMATAGHTPDHFSLCSHLHGIVLAGDALYNRRNRLKASPKRISADATAARESARRLLRLHPAIIACGHGPPSTDHSADEVIALYRRLQC